ncbi:hypothetical protein DYB31_013183 [Aphanomyces astaci]|uniref:Uncharacterized protein n=1 Tax=Aphanomyces astaci TaxID=112090 RepID=A0A397ES08_APHAT|nr:hypothetical protein DYB31_013183 [Aphanomyces astaci]
MARQRGLAHWHFQPFALAPASAKATDKRPPYPGAPKAKTPWRIGVATACPQAATRRTPAQSSPVHSTRTRCVKTSCFRQDGLPSHLVNYPKVVVVDALKADQAATAVANAMAKVAGAVEQPEHPSSTPFSKVTPQAANKVMHPAAHRATLPAAIQATPAWDKAAIPTTPASISALIATINAAVACFVSRPPATAVAQATGTVTTAKTAGIIATTAAITTTTAGPTATTAAPTKTTGAAAARRRSTKATPNRPPPPSAAKAAARCAGLPIR